jgi:alpha-beta hydrolase superfamily lysophospholipase
VTVEARTPRAMNNFSNAMSREVAAPSEMGVHAGRPYMLWLPAQPPPWRAMLVLHGAGSRKENHGDFGRACAASGWAALAYDQRGHGESPDAMSPEALADVGRMARFLAGIDGVDDSRLCVRGSSMGGFMAIQAAATSDAIAGAIAICPAGAHHLTRGLERDDLDMRIDEAGASALAAWLAEHDLRQAVELMGSKPLLLIHARGDDQIPADWSEELHARAAEPRKLILLPGGHHRSAQHDAELHGLALRWMERQLA